MPKTNCATAGATHPCRLFASRFAAAIRTAPRSASGIGGTVFAVRKAVAVPPADLANRFGEFAKSVFAQIKCHDEESRTLAELRDALLPKLLSGELRVPAAAGKLAETAP